MAPGLPTRPPSILGEQQHVGLIPGHLGKSMGAHPRGQVGRDTTVRADPPCQLFGGKSLPRVCRRGDLELLAVRGVQQRFPTEKSPFNGWSSSGDRHRMGINHPGSLSLPGEGIPGVREFPGEQLESLGSLLEQGDPGGNGDSWKSRDAMATLSSGSFLSTGL